MVKKTYKEKLLDPRWQRLRLEVMQRDNFTCQYCGDTERTLNIHHLSYNINGNPWDIDDFALICICEDCHYVEYICERLEPLMYETINEIFCYSLFEINKNHAIKTLVKSVVNKIIKSHPKHIYSKSK